MDTPHIDFPVRVSDGRLALVEQDSPAEIASCVAAHLITPVGSIHEMPQFGVTEPTFGGGQDLLTAVSQVAAQEPRWAPEVRGIVADGLVWRMSLTVGG